jgi:hypothetical protein
MTPMLKFWPAPRKPAPFWWCLGENFEAAVAMNYRSAGQEAKGELNTTNLKSVEFGIDPSAPSLWIFIGLIVIGVAVGLIWFFRRRRRSSN